MLANNLKCSNQVQFGQEKKIRNNGCMYPCASSTWLLRPTPSCAQVVADPQLCTSILDYKHTQFCICVHFGLNLTWTATIF